MSLLKTKAHKQLERDWYQRLKEEAFKDIEDTSNDFRDLKKWDSHYFLKFNESQKEAIHIYYAEAQDILNNHEFESPEHEEIWRLHCEGLTEREIAHRVPRYKKSMVHYIIDQIARMIKD